MSRVLCWLGLHKWEASAFEYWVRLTCQRGCAAFRLIPYPAAHWAKVEAEMERDA